jgi:hypothetical protein
MEGIGLHNDDADSPIVTVISDDNFTRALQRTIIVQFVMKN